MGFGGEVMKTGFLPILAPRGAGQKKDTSQTKEARRRAHLSKPYSLKT
jgi:hypothetical protein